MARQAPPLSPSLHPDLELVAEPDRALVRQAHRKGHPPRNLPLVPELINAIEAYLQANNENPEPFVWTATAEQILAKVQRGRVTLNQLANQN